MREREEWERLEMERKAKPRTGAVSEAYLVPGSRPGKGDGWMWMGMGTFGWKGKGKTNGIEFQSDGAWPEWPTRTTERHCLLGAPPGFSAWPATYGSLASNYLVVRLFCLPSQYSVHRYLA